MIIVGYPGIGKSSLAGHLINTGDGHQMTCIDLESSNFNNTEDTKTKDWCKYYINIAIDLSNQGFIVFVSSHKDVIEELVRRDTVGSPHNMTIIIPNLDYKTAWIDKLYHRTKSHETDKNRRAYEHVKDCFDKDMEQLLDYSEKYNINLVQIQDPYNYRLEDVVETAYELVTFS